MHDRFDVSLSRSFERGIAQCQDLIDWPQILLLDRMLFDHVRCEGAQRHPQRSDSIKQFARPGYRLSCSLDDALVRALLACLCPPTSQGIRR